MKIESSNTKIQPNLMGSVVRSGILTAVTSSFVLSSVILLFFNLFKTLTSCVIECANLTPLFLN